MTNRPNGTSTNYQYDFASRLTNITHNSPAGLIESLTYNYDAAGNRISLTRAIGTASLLPQAVQAAYRSPPQPHRGTDNPGYVDPHARMTAQD